ncbi:hypothetical protein EH240_28585 [Mesorhizobium tamadayense]|uniref:Uncharacterized protein n=1 Tax=Mesorhizobium tamadayense TaxID=425306 RepID=A0A3P3F6P0_9HYPH|nr:hypothetical protein [Mesorhizobium tamadayense]RRH93906.1 hypothetical protein EH240_28585 [Mesorhizobium tamadayense]
MSAELVFATSNNFAQGRRQGICTAAAMNWAKRVLEKGPVDTFDRIGLDEHILNMQMATLRTLDNQPAEQCDRVGLRMVGGQDRNVGSVGDVVRLGDDNPADAIIFWTNEHTMAYRHNEFFDIEVGLYRAKTTADIEKKMKEITGAYGGLVGARVVALK